MIHLLIDNTLLQLLTKEVSCAKLIEKQRKADEMVSRSGGKTPFTLIVPMALVIEFLGFRALDTSTLKQAIHSQLTKALDQESNAARRSELLSGLYEDVHSFFENQPSVKSFASEHPSPVFRSNELAKGVETACRITRHQSFAYHLAGFLSRDYLQTLAKPKSKLSTPDAAEQILHALKMFEADADGVRMFPLKIIDSLLQSYRLINSAWPPPQELRVKERKDLNDSAYLDFAWRGWWSRMGRHPVTVYTCENRDTVLERCQAYKAVIESWNHFVKKMLPAEQHEDLMFRLRPGRIVCFDHETLQQTWSRKLGDIR